MNGIEKMKKSRKMPRAAAAGLACLLAAATLCGCSAIESGGSKPAGSSSAGTPAAEEGKPPATGWRAVDRTALLNSLGWGQILKGSPAGKTVALTFDCGAEGKYAPAILDALEGTGVDCTFFVTGQFIESYPQIAKRIVSDGHELGNHSYSHPRFTEISLEEVRSQIDRTESLAKANTGESTKPYFRFPYGAGSDALIREINSLGYACALWTYDTVDWDESTTADKIRAGVASHAGPGAIILMHLGSQLEAGVLPGVISGLRASGYKVGTLTEAVEGK